MSSAGCVCVRPLFNLGQYLRHVHGQCLAGYSRIVDEDVQLAAINLGDFFMAFLDAVGVGDVEGYDADSQVGQLCDDFGATSSGNYM